MKKQKFVLITIALLAITAAGYSMFAAEQKPTDYAKPTVDLTGIEAPPNEKLAFSLYAVGTQTYACESKKGAFEWATGSTPKADLYNDKGELVGKHFGGPTWATLDGSSNVVGDVSKRKEKLGVGNTIAWLWLPVSSPKDGMFGNVSSIHRVTTVGGVGPKGKCDPKDTSAGSVFYSATYYFNKLSTK